MVLRSTEEKVSDHNPLPPATPSADFSAVSLPNATYLYYYSSSLSPGTNITINELQLPLLPNTTALSTPSALLVVEPLLQANDADGRNASVFVPLAATTSPEKDAISVFYTEDVEDSRSGYGGLRSAWRLVGKGWGEVSYGTGANEQEVDLGN